MVVIGVVLLAQLAAAPTALASSEVKYFPGSYFDTSARDDLHRTVMSRWPGPGGLRQLWESGELAEEGRVALLLGAASHHDPELLPIYFEALGSESERVRQAAAYGYHDLLGDLLPDVGSGIERDVAERLQGEIRAVRWTLGRRSLVEMWVHAALVSDGSGLPGFRGIFPKRPTAVCLSAVDRLMGPEDLELLAEAYQLSLSRDTRITILKLIEGLTLNVFIERPQGDRAAWGDEIYVAALARLDGLIERWRSRRCAISYRRVVSNSMERLGARGVDPLRPDACAVWTAILVRGDARWWATAARRLYECGGPWVELSVLQAESAVNSRRRDWLVDWYGLRDSRRVGR